VQPHETLLQVLLIGITNGSIIALIALGYTMVYGIIELINFAHGDVYMIGSLTALTLVNWVPPLMNVRRPTQMETVPLVLLTIGAFLAAMVLCAVLNMFIERFAYRPLRYAPRLAPLISAIGVSFILANIGLIWIGPSPVDFPRLLPDTDIIRDVLKLNTPVFFRLADLFVIVIALPLMIALNQFVNRTRLGKAMRATAQDREAAAMMGININQTIALTFLLGGALAGAGGFVNGVVNNTAIFNQGFRAGLYAFTAAVLGGVGNISGAFLGGMIIGIIAAFSDLQWDPRWTQVVVFALLILILIFKPTGLLGEETTERA
jgi:branched-chain amino acid transport system permease protein